MQQKAEEVKIEESGKDERREEYIKKIEKQLLVSSRNKKNI
jgi:hypothetical protein